MDVGDDRGALLRENHALNDQLAEHAQIIELLARQCVTISAQLRANSVNPLGTIDGCSEILLEHLHGPLTAEQETYLRNIRDASQVLGKLIVQYFNDVRDSADAARRRLSD